MIVQGFLVFLGVLVLILVALTLIVGCLYCIFAMLSDAHDKGVLPVWFDRFFRH